MSTLPILMGDLIAVLAANLLAVALRFDFDWAAMTRGANRSGELVLIDLVLTPLIFIGTGLYRGYWRYAGLSDLVRLSRAIAYRSIGLIVALYLFSVAGVSRAVVITSTGLLLGLTGALRLAPRFLSEARSSRARVAGSRTLIYGAGDTGELLLRDLQKRTGAGFNVVGFVDDNPEMAGVRIHGVPVLGTRRNLEALVSHHGIRELIIAVPSASARDIREIFEVCAQAGVRFRTVPTHGELERGAARIGQIRPVQTEDLLGREVVNLDREALNGSLLGKRIMITGAAGSIGRELARQIAAYGPESLTLLDRNENNLFYLDADLKQTSAQTRFHVVVADILDRERMTRIFSTLRPQVVFHAAAFKHVPLMELQPEEAVKNNVLATRCLVELAAAGGVERFIFISTDKAVRPSCVMGATKRLGERLIRSQQAGPTRFMAVRFGNVLASDGSVIPTFRRQIASGGPVTVTHPEATRYFMTIPEAVELVLLAGAMGEGGETFLLRMGQPVRILDLAKNTISLSGLRPEVDIPIVFTGLRPGEKMHEELVGEGETALPTSNDKIMVLAGVEALSEDDLRCLADLEEAARMGREEQILELLRKFVPDYAPVTLAPAPKALPSRPIAIGGVVEARA